MNFRSKVAIRVNKESRMTSLNFERDADGLVGEKMRVCLMSASSFYLKGAGRVVGCQMLFQL